MNTETIAIVFVGSLATALATGLGVLPLKVLRLSERQTGIWYAVAAGLMLAASIALVQEGYKVGTGRMLLGMVLGFATVAISAHYLGDEQQHIVRGSLAGTGTAALLLVGVMTVHSFAEGVGIGVAFGPGEKLGLYVTLAIAVHNIPEGLAIGLALMSRGMSTIRAAGWAIFTSLPQPLVAVPAFMFVEAAQSILPIGLGFAAGAMLWMIAASILPTAIKQSSVMKVGIAATISCIAMSSLQLLMR